MDGSKQRYHISVIGVVAIVGIVAIFFGYFGISKLAPLQANVAEATGRDLVGGAIDSFFPLSASKDSLAPGEEYTISWGVPSTHTISPKDWVALVPVDHPNWPGELPWAYTDGQNSGVVTLKSPSAPGTYEPRYYQNNGVTPISKGPKVTITDGLELWPLSASSEILVIDQEYTISWGVPSTHTISPKDWVALVPVDHPNWPGSLPWIYTDGEPIGSRMIKAPSAAGTYEVRYYPNNGVTPKAKNGQVIVVANLECADSDGGSNYYQKGAVLMGIEEFTDFCYNYDIGQNCSGNEKGCVLAEHSCNKDNTLFKEKYACPNGCSDGACIKEPPVCGDGKLNPSEHCDVTPLTVNCATLGFAGGLLKCDINCRLDTNGCIN